MTHDADDLPPAKKPEEPRTLGTTLGEVFGAGVWIAAILALAALLAWAAISWLS
ncbi:MAG: hypothetical protein ACT4OG_07455 [Alphaproteobacteria bacterium]